jgi:D-alanine-D-alanine ligase
VAQRQSQTKAAPNIAAPRTKAHPVPKADLFIDEKALKRIKLIAVAYSHVEREWFSTEQAYLAEVEVEDRARQILETLQRLKIPAKGYPSDQYFVTNLIVDDPDLVLNLVDTLRGRDVWQTSIPAALMLTNIPYTGTGMQGLVIGNNRDIFKMLLRGYDVPTPDFQIIRDRRTKLRDDLTPPLICKLNESGGSVGIDNHAVRETHQDAQARIDELLTTYRLPVLVEKFIDGPEIMAIVYEDARKKHTFLAEKVFTHKPDGKHAFTSFESYDLEGSYGYKIQPLTDEKLARKIQRYAETAFSVLRYRDYAKFDIRVDAEAGIPYFTDANPNTAIGPDPLLPLTEILAMHGINFDTWLKSLISKQAKNIPTR